MKSRVILALVSFFFVFGSFFFFYFGPVFWCYAPNKKKPIQYSDGEFYARHFETKIFQKSLRAKKARPTLKIFSRAISSHLISFRFFPFSGHFRKRQEFSFGSSESRKICRFRWKKSSDYLKRNGF